MTTLQEARAAAAVLLDYEVCSKPAPRPKPDARRIDVLMGMAREIEQKIEADEALRVTLDSEEADRQRAEMGLVTR